MRATQCALALSSFAAVTACGADDFDDATGLDLAGPSEASRSRIRLRTSAADELRWILVGRGVDVTGTEFGAGAVDVYVTPNEHAVPNLLVHMIHKDNAC